MCNNSQVYDALVFFRKLEKDEMMKDASLYTILIGGFSKCGNLNMTMDLFDELLLKGLNPTIMTYTVMEEDGSLPSSGTYNAIVRELLKKNERQEAENFLDEMINRDFVLDYSIFSMLLPLMPNVGQDSRLRSIIQKLKDVEKKHVGIRDIISRIIS
ncbi:putative tetratricopeptide-like helical domain-containing protein [Tanacetum coccineum]